MSIGIIIADDHKIVRQGLKVLLMQNNKLDIEVLAEAQDGHQAVSLTAKMSPDILIVDISMPVLNGIDATKMVCKDFPETKVIGLSMHKNMNYVLHLFHAGAYGYILKDSAFEDIIEAVATVLKKQYYLSPKLNLSVSELIEKLKEFSREKNVPGNLSIRERQVLQLIAEGKGTKEIARILSRSVKTIESHRKNIMDKLNIHSVAELTAYAIQEGLIFLDR